MTNISNLISDTGAWWTFFATNNLLHTMVLGPIAGICWARLAKPSSAPLGAEVQINNVFLTSVQVQKSSAEKSTSEPMILALFCIAGFFAVWLSLVMLQPFAQFMFDFSMILCGTAIIQCAAAAIRPTQWRLIPHLLLSAVFAACSSWAFSAAPYGLKQAAELARQQPGPISFATAAGPEFFTHTNLQLVGIILSTCVTVTVLLRTIHFFLLAILASRPNPRPFLHRWAMRTGNSFSFKSVLLMMGAVSLGWFLISGLGYGVWRWIFEESLIEIMEFIANDLRTAF